MLTVWSVCVGDKYPIGYVYALQDMVKEYLTIPHEFKCITPHKIPGVITVQPFVPYQGWWSKINLFTPRTAQGPSLYFDLDVVITGSLDYLADYTDHQFAAPANWAQSGHGGIQSSVMAWHGNWTRPYDELQWPEARSKYWGDQEWLWDLLGDDWIRIAGIGSYKYHVRPTGQIPDDMRVCVFHGEPKPLDVNEPCLSPYISTLHSHIKSHTANGLERVS